MVTMVHVDEVGTARRWAMLAIALGSTAGANVFINGVAFLIPALHAERGLDLANAGLLSAMPSFGMVLTLIAWGALIDKFGERIALVTGLALTAVAAFAAAESPSLTLTGALLLLGGAAAAACNSASGRVVVGWFPPHQRGTVMGIRQMAQPLGVAAGALVIPRIAEGHGVATALLFPAIVCAVSSAVCLVGIIDPPRPPRSEAPEEHLANPYRGSRVLWLIHGVSVLLVVPQVVVWTFTLVWLVTDRGWSIGAASVMVTVAQLVGALGRVAAGMWSDRWGSRMRPIRAIAASASRCSISGDTWGCSWEFIPSSYPPARKTPGGCSGWKPIPSSCRTTIHTHSPRPCTPRSPASRCSCGSLAPTCPHTAGSFSARPTPIA
ncbi:Probable major facilitator superfamily [Mycobacteroides abscessus]|nr:Probable major facilitator superfamily [Mycobacteroides abscessus]